MTGRAGPPPLRSRTANRRVSRERLTDPAATFPVSSTERLAEALPFRSCDGVLASVAALKLVYTSAEASRTAADRATTSLILRLRAGSNPPDLRRCARRGGSGAPRRATAPGPTGDAHRWSP